ncbi:MAG: RHS repeat-associated core domain-containing protein [Desulfuromonadaceae bacterium]|nr:RHS repeat-associated core domain-containing protein [Desulfuromonadaceae bacterium]
MIVDSVGQSVNRRVFTGKEIDQNSGLIYFGARYYDPDTARFITQDTYLGEQGTPPSLHKYLYAYSNPTVYIDLFGYEALKLEYRKPPEQSFFDKWVFDSEHAKDIYRGMVHGTSVRHYGQDSARVDAFMDLEYSVVETVLTGKAIGTAVGALKKPVVSLAGKGFEKLPGAAKVFVETTAKISKEVKNGVKEFAQEILDKSKDLINNSPLGNIRGQAVLRHGAEETAKADFYVSSSGTTLQSKHWNTYSGMQDMISKGELPAPASLGNIDARIWYLSNDEMMGNKINKLLPLEDQAKQAYELRASLRSQTRDFMSDRAAAEKLRKNEPNLTWEQMIVRKQKKGLSGDDVWHDIIKSATTVTRDDTNYMLLH